MGELLLRSGIADRMFGALAAWLGRLPGGLLHTNVGCSALFAATSGSSVATAATIGTVALPSLHKRGYSMSHVAGLDRRRRHAGHPDPAVGQHDHLRLADRHLDRQAVHRRHHSRPAAGRRCFMAFIAVHALVTGTAIREDKVPLADAAAPAEGPGAAGGGVLHRDGQPVQRPGDDHRIGRAGRRGVAVLRLEEPQAELGCCCSTASCRPPRPAA